MGRPPSDDPRDTHITVRLTGSERATLDRKRGGLSVGEYVRSLFLGKP